MDYIDLHVTTDSNDDNLITTDRKQWAIYANISFLQFGSVEHVQLFIVHS